jgi:nicotinamide-nucleotide amidase
MIAARARIVSVGACEAPLDGLEPLRRAVEGAGLIVASCVLVDEDDAALDGALAGDGELVVILEPATAPPGAVRRAVARACAVPLVLHDRLLERAGAGRAGGGAAAHEERQALLPRGAKLWEGRGGEPAWCVRTERRAFAVLPQGADVESILADRLPPFAGAVAAGRAAVVTRTLRTAGLAPNAVAARAAGVADGAGAEVTAACSARDGEVLVRLRARAATREAALALMAGAEARLRTRLGDDCYGVDGETLEQVVGRLLRDHGLMLTVAESCTGGLLGHRITSVPGSSAWFERGVLVYSNRAKQELLGVPERILREHGAVSAPCAEAMVRGAARLGDTPCALAVTGIAGPDGGTPTKPVGTVFVGVAVGEQVEAQRFLFSGPRASVKAQSAQAALDLLRRRLLARPAAVRGRAP